MLAYLKGTITSKEMTGGPADRLVLDVSGVGFELTVAHKVLYSIGAVGDQIKIHTALSIRENEWTIFGFSDADEKEMFGLLQTVSGIGPKLALAITGTLGVRTFVEAVLSDNQKLISQAPGVGAKVAQRIILELRSKLEEWNRKRNVAESPSDSDRSQTRVEVEEILEGLGYTPTEINLALKKAREDALDDNVEELVRFSLRVLGAATVLKQ